MRKMTSEEFDERVQFFDEMACSTWMTRLHDRLITMTSSWEQLSVLDVGCGTGRLLLKGANPSTKLTGVDISRGMVERASEIFAASSIPESNYHFLVADAEQLPFAEEQFHLVLSTCVIFLLPNPEAALKEMYRVLKPGGEIALINPTIHLNMRLAEELIEKWNYHGADASTLRQWGKVSERRHQFDEKYLEELLSKHHFTVIEQQLQLENIALLTVAKKKGI